MGTPPEGEHELPERHRDEQVIAAIRLAVAKFWRSVARNEPPPPVISTRLPSSAMGRSVRKALRDLRRSQPARARRAGKRGHGGGSFHSAPGCAGRAGRVSHTASRPGRAWASSAWPRATS